MSVVFDEAVSSLGREQGAAGRPAITTEESSATSPAVGPKSMLIVWGLCGFAGNVHFSLHTGQLTHSIEGAKGKLLDYLHQSRCLKKTKQDVIVHDQVCSMCPLTLKHFIIILVPKEAPDRSGIAAKESVPRHVAPMSSLVSASAGSVPKNSFCSPCTSCMAQVFALPAHTFLSDSRAMPSSSSLASHAPLSC